MAWAVTTLYVIGGLFLWYRHGVPQWAGPGSVTGDAIYHLIPSLPAPVLLSGETVGGKLLLCGALLALWFELDVKGYGPVRG